SVAFAAKADAWFLRTFLRGFGGRFFSRIPQCSKTHRSDSFTDLIREAQKSSNEHSQAKTGAFDFRKRLDALFARDDVARINRPVILLFTVDGYHIRKTAFCQNLICLIDRTVLQAFIK